MPPRTIESREADGALDKVAAAHERLIDLVTGLQSGNDWAAALAAAARFHRYSFGNALLILASHADAYARGLVPDPVPDLVAGYRTWQTLDRQVMAGQHGHTILCPRTRLVREAITASGERRDVGRGEQPQPGESLTQRTALVGWSIGTVFSMSQTDGAGVPMPPTPRLLSGRAPVGLWDGLAAHVAAAGYCLREASGAATLQGANGITNFALKTVTVRADMDEAARCKTLAHELGHVLLHAAGPNDVDTRGQGPACRGVLEVEAESVAFIVAAAHGMDTSAYTLPYVASWAGGADPAATVRATGERVSRAARRILERLDTLHGYGGQPPVIDRAVRLEASPRHAVGRTSGRPAPAVQCSPGLAVAR